MKKTATRSTISAGTKRFYQYTALLVLIALIAIAVTVSLYYSWYLIDYTEVNASIKVTNDTLGFNTDNDALRFGKGVPGSATTRYFTLSTPHHARVILRIEGNISPLITLSDNNFILQPDELKSVTAHAVIPEGTALGEYSGTVKVYFYRY